MRQEGYEAADYPFLAALAMFGTIGVLVFVPVYIVIIKVLIKDIRYLSHCKRNTNIIMFLLFLTFILYFIFDLMQYFNSFFPISNSSKYIWYSLLSFYLASRHNFYFNQNKEKLVQKIAVFK